MSNSQQQWGQHKYQNRFACICLLSMGATMKCKQSFSTSTEQTRNNLDSLSWASCNQFTLQCSVQQLYHYI